MSGTPFTLTCSSLPTNQVMVRTSHARWGGGRGSYTFITTPEKFTRNRPHVSTPLHKLSQADATTYVAI